MQQNPYLLTAAPTATRYAEKVPNNIVQFTRGSPSIRYIDVVSRNGLIHSFLRNFFYDDTPPLLYWKKSCQNELGIITATVLQKIKESELWREDHTTQQTHMHQILQATTMSWVNKVDDEIFAHFVFGLLDDFETKLHQNSDRMTKYLDEPYMIIHRLKNADRRMRGEIVQHLFTDNRIDWFLQRIGLNLSHDVQP
jgi:hypothetical protein